MKRFLTITLIVLISCFATAFVAYAQSYTPLAPLPIGVGGTTPTAYTISTYLSGMIKLLIALGGAISVLMAIIGGTQYVAAGVSPDAKSGAKERITNAFIGLALVLTSYLILNSISPKLVQFNFMLPPVAFVPGVETSSTAVQSGSANVNTNLSTLKNGATNLAIQTPVVVAVTPPSNTTTQPSSVSPNVDTYNDYSIIVYCLTVPTYELCSKADFNNDGKTDSADFMLFAEKGGLLDLNSDKKVDTNPSVVPASCFLKTSTADLPGALLRKNICLDSNGYNIECTNERGVFYGQFINNIFSLVGVNHTFFGSGVGYRDLPPPPTLNFSVAPLSMSVATDIVLQWNPTDATDCSASGEWAGSKTATGLSSQKIKLANPGTYNYTLSCSGRGGSTTQTSTVVYDKSGAISGLSGASASVAAASTAVPTATITVTAVSLLQNRAVISWSSTLATSCTASGGWSGLVAASGSTTGSLSKTTATTYYLTCQGPGGSVTASATADLNNTMPWIAASELGSACATDQGLMSMPFGYDYTGSGQYTKFQRWVTDASSGNSVDLNKLFSEIFWVWGNISGTSGLRFVETSLGKLVYTTIAQYDLNNDGTANFNAGGADIAVFDGCKGKAVSGVCAQADFNGDGVIDSHDLMLRDLVMKDVYSQPTSVLMGYYTDTGTNVVGSATALYGQSFGFVPYRWVLNQFESMFFDPTRYTDKQAVGYCVGHKPTERCAMADIDGSCRAKYLGCGVDMTCRASAEACVVDASDVTKFDAGVTRFDINGDGKVDLQ